MADEHGVFEVEVLDDGEEIVRVSVHVVAVPGLARSSVTATIVGDDSVAMLSQEEHLVLPVVAVEGPAMAENDWLASWVSPVLVEDFGLVFSGDERHGG